MKKNTIIWIIVVVVILIVIGVVVSNNNSSATPSAAAPMIPAATQTAPTPSGTVVLNTGTSAALGTFLVAANGMTLYQYAKDTSGVSNCTGACATAWPPYTVSSSGPLSGATGISGAVSTITRSDGTMQVTYNGMPLYFFQSDSQAGDATGQNVNGFSVVMP